MKPTATGEVTRAFEGQSAHMKRGRLSAPRIMAWISPVWRPIAGKIAGGMLAASVLAAVGFRAHPPNSVLDSDPVVIRSTVIAGPAMAGAMPSPTGLPGAADPTSQPSPSTGGSSVGPPDPISDGGDVHVSSAILPDGRIVLNLAGEDDLRRIPGIGPARARAILALRQRLAKFRAVEDLLRVKGIGRKMIQRIKPRVVVDSPPRSSADHAKGTTTSPTEP